MADWGLVGSRVGLMRLWRGLAAVAEGALYVQIEHHGQHRKPRKGN